MSGSSLGTALKEIESLNRQLNKAQKAESQVILCALVSCESTKFRRAKPPLAHAAQVKVLQSKLTTLQGDFQQLQESKNSFLAAPLTTVSYLYSQEDHSFCGRSNEAMARQQLRWDGVPGDAAWSDPRSVLPLLMFHCAGTNSRL